MAGGMKRWAKCCCATIVTPGFIALVASNRAHLKGGGARRAIAGSQWRLAAAGVGRTEPVSHRTLLSRALGSSGSPGHWRHARPSPCDGRSGAYTSMPLRFPVLVWRGSVTAGGSRGVRMRSVSGGRVRASSGRVTRHDAVVRRVPRYGRRAWPRTRNARSNAHAPPRRHARGMFGW